MGSRITFADCILEDQEEIIQRDLVDARGPFDRQRFRGQPPDRVLPDPFHTENFHDVGDVTIFFQDRRDPRVFRDVHVISPNFWFSGFLPGIFAVVCKQTQQAPDFLPTQVTPLCVVNVLSPVFGIKVCKDVLAYRFGQTLSTTLVGCVVRLSGMFYQFGQGFPVEDVDLTPFGPDQAGLLQFSQRPLDNIRHRPKPGCQFGLGIPCRPE